jgi:hypothetical protein
LPTLATDCPNTIGTAQLRVVSHHINITVVGILIGLELRMILAWEKLYIVSNEIAAMYEVFLNKLLKDVFFG